MATPLLGRLPMGAAPHGSGSSQKSWSDIVEKFKAIEDDLVKQGKYIDAFDALLLSSVEIDGDPASVIGDKEVLFTPTTKLNGLTRLVGDLAAVLHEAYIEQQTEMMALQAEMDRARNFSEDNATLLRYQQMAAMYQSLLPAELGSSSSSSGTGGGSKSSVDTAAGLEQMTTVAWDTEPDDSETSPMLSATGPLDERLQKADLVRKQLRRSLQDVHAGVHAVLSAKLVAYEVVSSCLEGYLRYVVDIAKDNGVSSALTRAKRLVQPQLNDLLAHRFLETVEAQTLLGTVRSIWAGAFLRNDLVLAEVNLAQSLSTANAVEELGLPRFKMGAGLMLLLWSFSECFNNEQGDAQIWHDPTFAIFMCFGDLLLLLWMWGVSMRVWRLAGIDFVRLLRLEGTEIKDLRTPEATVFASATDLSLLFLTVFICFNKARRGVFSMHASLAVAHALPVSMVAFFIYRLTFPAKPRRKWMHMLWLVLTAPANPVIFRDGYIGDLLTSLVRVLTPMCFSFAYLIMSAAAWLSNDIKAVASTSSVWWQDSAFYRLFLVPFVTLMPLWIRLMQCLRRSVETGQRWPHLANALKYTSALAVISFGTFRPQIRGDPVWVAAFVGATLFQFSWDLTMDWGIVVSAGYKDATDATFMGLALRRTRLLGPLSTYLAVIVANFFMRFAWALTLLPEAQTEGKSFYSSLLFHLGPMVAAGEVVRRMVWGFFRLEWEQLEVFGSPVFERMSVGRQTLGPDKDTAPAATTTTATAASTATLSQSIADDWVLTAPFVASLASAVLGAASMDTTASARTRARFVEAVLFALAVGGIIVAAAMPELRLLFL